MGPGAPEVLKLRAFYNHPGFVEANADRVRDALAGIPESRRDDAHLVFTAHSIPSAMAAQCRYEDQLAETSRLVAETVGPHEYSVVYQSRSGSPHVPWLEPDVSDRLRELRDAGVTDVVVSPVGFVSDHMEVLYDLDVEAAATARGLGLTMVRAGAAGTHPAFVSMIRELISERLDRRRPPRRRSLRPEPRGLPLELLPTRHREALPLGRRSSCAGLTWV